MTDPKEMSDWYDTKDGGDIVVTPRTRQHMAAHLDVVPLLAEAIVLIDLPTDGKWLEVEVDLGRVIGRSGCVETAAIGMNDTASFAYREGRAMPSRIVEGVEGPEVTTVVVIAKYVSRGKYQLVTAWVGALGQREPWNAGGPDFKDAMTFWQTHALIFDPSNMESPFESTWGTILGRSEGHRIDARTHELATLTDRLIAEGGEPLFPPVTKPIRKTVEGQQKEVGSLTETTYVLFRGICRIEIPGLLKRNYAGGTMPEFFHTMIATMNVHARVNEEDLVHESQHGLDKYRLKLNKDSKPVLVTEVRINVKVTEATTGDEKKYYLTVTPLRRPKAGLKPKYDVVMATTPSEGEDVLVFGPDKNGGCVSLVPVRRTRTIEEAELDVLFGRA